MSITNHNTQWEFTSLPLTTKTNIMPNTFSLPSSNPLFSTIVTLYILILLYFPHFFFKLIFSPLFISTFILLLSLLRFGASQQLKPPGRASPGPSDEPNPGPGPKPELLNLQQGQCNLAEPGPQPKPEKCDEGIKETDTHQEQAAADKHPGRALDEPVIRPEMDSFGRAQNREPGPRLEPEKPDEDIKETDTHQEQEVADEHPGRALDEPVIRPELEPCGRAQNHGPGPNLYYCGKGYLEWEFGAPLEVIYEAHEGEEEGEEGQNDAFHEENYNEMAKLMLDKYPSLSKYYPESDSDSDSESCSSWSLDDEQEEREELIEIALDYHGGSNISNKEVKKLVDEVHVDDDDEEEEDNLIEIDISPTTRNGCHGFSW